MRISTRWVSRFVLLGASFSGACSGTDSTAPGIGGNSTSGIGGTTSGPSTSGVGGATEGVSTISAGGALGTGGTSSGGSPNSGGTRTGGSSVIGGTTNAATGGAATTGGAAATGGIASVAGNNTGGSNATGGATSAGGKSSTGGVVNSGGTPATGGSKGTGGATTTSTAPQGTYIWASVALGGGGFVSAVIASLLEKNVFFARTDVGGLYRWAEASQSWLALTDFASEGQTGFLGVEAVALDPQTPGRLYALVGIDYFNGGKTAILSSTNNGDTFTVTEVTSQWKAHGNGMGRQNGERLAVDPNLGSILFCGTRRNGLFKSTNYGAAWSAVTSFPVTTTANDNGISFVVFDKSSSSAGKATGRIFAGVSRLNASNFYMSTDGGTSWAAVAGAPATTQMPQRAALASNGMLYITYANGAGPSPNSSGTEPMNAGSIWRYDIAQGSWTNVTPSGATVAFSGISVDAADANHLVATSINTYVSQPWGWGDRYYVSTNGGTSWTDPIGSGSVTMDSNGMPWIVNHAIHWAGTATFDPFNSERVFITSGNGVFGTTNLSASKPTLKFMSKSLEETVPLEAVSIPGYGFANVIGDYDGLVTTDVTVSPSAGVHKPSMGTTSGLALAGAAPGTMARVGSAIYRTTNNGGSWSEVARPNTQTYGTLALSADGAVLLWTPDSSTTTYRTANNGSQWATVTGLNVSGSVTGDTVNANKFYAYNPSSGAFYVSTNGGTSFTQTATAGGGGSSKIRAVPGVEGDIWVPLNGGGLTRSTNSGTSFAKVSSVQRCDAVGFGKAAVGETFPAVYMWGNPTGGVVGIYRSIDGGATWERINDDAHQFGGPGNGHFILGDMNVYGRVYMSTAGRGTIYGEPR